MSFERFQISSEELELLVLFEELSDVTQLGQRLGRDPSGISRSIKRLAERFPVLEKRSGKWVLTDMGRQINGATRSALARQKAILSSHRLLRIGTNREFAARIMATDFSSIRGLFPSTEIAINAFETGTEQALITGSIDVGIDCDRPNDPEIAYKLVVAEPIILVSSKKFLKSHRSDISNKRFATLPHLLCERLYPDRILSMHENQFCLAGRFNDIASARSACINGAGWALLPRYAVAEELKSGILIQLEPTVFGNSKYGVWWPRRRPDLKTSAEKLVAWLETKAL